MLRRFLLGALMMSLASFAVAGVPDLNASTATIGAGAAGASVFVVPTGEGEPLTNAFLAGGASVDATITLHLVNTDGDDLFGYPGEDLWIITSGGSLASCTGGTTADQSTDIDGMTTFTGPFAAGGNTFGETAQVVVAGAAIAGAGVNVIFNSADFNGDLTVGISDIAAFTQLLGGSAFEGDFNRDGVVGISDIGRFVPAIGRGCGD
jgi:hypothetical protein